MDIPSALDLTRDLVRLDTVNPPGNERACAHRLGALLEAHGFRIDYREFADRRTSLVARIGGSDERAPICFTGHIDTVPLGAAPWSREPFAAETDAGRLYGRGTSDMKSGVAAFTVAALALARRLERTAGVVLVITADEEIGCGGAAHLARLGDALGRAGAIVVGEPTANYPMVGHKGALWLNAIARGVTAHGSMPERGVNAAYRAARAITRLEEFRFGTPAHALMGNATLNVGTVHGGQNINSVPDRTEIGIDIRTVPGVAHDELVGRLRRELGETIELDTLLDVAPVYTDPGDPWIAQVFETMAPVLGERPQPRCATYFTDAAVLGAAYDFPPTVILGPGEPQMAHQTDEYCEIERIREATDAYVTLMQRWTGA